MGILTKMKQIEVLAEEIAALRAENTGLCTQAAELHQQVQHLARDLASSRDQTSDLCKDVDRFQKEATEQRDAFESELRRYRESNEREADERNRLLGSFQKMSVRLDHHMAEVDKITVGLLERIERAHSGSATNTSPRL